MAVFKINSAEINLSLESMTLSVVGQSSVSLNIWGLNEDVTVEWGDGTDQTATVVNTFPSPTFSKNYSTPYTGVITIKAQDLSNITRLISNSNLAFTTTEVSLLDGLQLINNGNNSSTISGNVADLPNSLETLVLEGNSISGSINSAQNIINWSVRGTNNLSGDIGNIPNSLSIEIWGYNTISGSIDTLNPNATRLLIGGMTTITGNIANLPGTVSNFSAEGNNTIFGDIADFNPTGGNMAIFVSGQTTITGDVSDLFSTSAGFNISGQNTIFGDLTTVPSSVVSINIGGPNHNVTGALGGVDYQLDVTGGNASAITGTLQDYNPPNNIDIGDSLLTFGNSDLGLVDKTSGKIDIGLEGNLAANLNYTAGLWNLGSGNYFRLFWNSSGNGMSPAEKDQFLIDLNNSTFDKGPSVISMNTNSSPRTSASDAAKAQLIIDGVLFIGSDL